MAKDDYYVIVYQILSYLYQCLKNDIKVQEKYLYFNNEKYFNIPESYWQYIIINMVQQELIDGVVLTKTSGKKYPIIVSIEDCMITPKGIEYLCDNSMIEKAKQFFKDVKEMTPFL